MRGGRSGWLKVFRHAAWSAVWLTFPAAAAFVSALPPADSASLIPGGNPAGAQAPPLTENARRKARALTLYFEGLSHVRRQDSAQAIESFLEVLQLDPTNVPLAKRVADTYAHAGRLDEALALLENTVRQNPARPDPLLHLSEFCVRHHNNSDAIRTRGFSAAREAVEKFPEHAPVYGNLVGLHLLEGASDAAAEVIAEAGRRPNPPAEFWLSLGGYASQVWPLREAANRSKVAFWYEKAIARAPDDPDILEPAADFFVRIGRLADAAELYARIVARRPEALRTRDKLAHSLALSGRGVDAVAEWERILSIDPESAATHAALAGFHSVSGETRKALIHRAAALRGSGKAALSDWLQLVRELLAAEMPAEAAEAAAFAESRHPESPEAAFHSAIAHGRVGAHEKALAGFERAARSMDTARPTTGPALDDGLYFEWGIALSRANRIDEAAEKLRLAAEHTPKEHPRRAARSWNALGYLWLEHNIRIEEAGALIQKALEVDPDNAAFLDSLGWYHFRKAEHEKALELLRRAGSASKDADPEILDHIAQTLHALGRHAEAIETLTRATAHARATDTMRDRLKSWQARP